MLAMARTSTRPRNMSPVNLTGAFELFGKSYAVVKKNFEIFLLLFAIPGLFALWDTFGRYVDNETNGGWDRVLTNAAFGPQTTDDFYGNAGGIMFLLFIPYAITALMVPILTLRSAEGHKPTFRSLWNEFVDRWLWLKLLGSLIVIGLAIVVGLLLLIVPGVIMLWRLYFTQFILIDQKVGIEEALRRSWRMTKPYAWPIYSIVLVTLLLSLTNLVPIFGGLIAFGLTTAYSVAAALRYHEIKKLS